MKESFFVEERRNHDKRKSSYKKFVCSRDEENS